MYYESKIFNKIGISKNYRDADPDTLLPLAELHSAGESSR